MIFCDWSCDQANKSSILSKMRRFVTYAGCEVIDFFPSFRVFASSANVGADAEHHSGDAR